MLENIKSKYIIIKNVFDLLEPRHKLKIIAYNKSLQGKCSININDYKNTAGCYVIKEVNGKYKIKTIENDLLIYEGDYFKGKKHGKGKLYKIMEAKLSELENQKGNELFLNKYKEFKKSQNINIENKKCTEESREGIIKKKGEKYFFFPFFGI